MKRTRFVFLMCGMAILAVIVACAPSGGLFQPDSGTNSGARETSVARTAQAAAEKTRQARLWTPTPTSIPLTPTPKISTTGTSLIVNDDQSVVFIDHKAGIQLIIPAGWLPVRIDQEEYYQAFTLDVTLENPPIMDRLTQIQKHNVDKFRLDAIDIRSGHIVNGVISDISVIFEANDFRTLEEWLQAERLQKFPFKGFKYLGSQYPRTADGTRVLVIERSWDAKNKGEKIYYRGVFFSLPTGTVVLDFQTNLSFKDAVLPDFEQVVNSLTLLNP